MNTPKWLFFVLVFWIMATLWCNALEPAATYLIPASASSTVRAMGDLNTATASGGINIGSWIGNIWKALSFDYGIFTGSWLGIIRVICCIFTAASLYLVADLIIAVWRVIWAALGKF